MNTIYSVSLILDFLDFRTHSSTLEPDAPSHELVPEGEQPGEPTVPAPYSQDPEPPQWEPCASGSTPRISVADRLREFIRRPGDPRRNPRDMDTLARLCHEALTNLEGVVYRHRDENVSMFRRSEAAGPSDTPSSTHYYLMSLREWIEDMTTEEKWE